jgi:tetratricopeptide (TPR) repeat protein
MRHLAKFIIEIVLSLSVLIIFQSVSQAVVCSKNEADFNLGNKYAKELAHDKAIEMFTKFIDSNRDSQTAPSCREVSVMNLASAYYNRGNSYLFKLDTDDAVADFTEAIKLQQNIPNYYYYRALAYAKSLKSAPEMRKERQMADLSSATKLDPNFGLKSIFMLGHDLITYKVIPEYPGEAEDVKKILDAGMDINIADTEGKTALMYAAAWGHESVVKLLLSRGADAAITDKRGTNALPFAVAEGKDNVVVLLEPLAKSEKDYYALALYYLNKKNSGKAAVYIDRAIRINADNPDTRLVQGNIFMAMKDYDSAIAAYQKTLALAPDNKIALHRLSLCYSSKAAAGGSENYSVIANKAAAHLKNGETEAAVEMFSRALEILLKEMEKEKNLDRYQSASWYSLFVSKFSDSERYAKEGLEMNSQAYNLRSNLGHACLLLGKKNEALIEYRKFLEQDRTRSVAALVRSLNEDITLLKLRYPEKKELFEWASSQLYMKN